MPTVLTKEDRQVALARTRGVMKAVRLHRYEERPVVEEVAEPEVRGPQDVVIRVGGAGLCRTDLHIVEGQWAEKSWRSVQAMYLLFRAADRRKSKRELAATSQLARVANLLTER